MSIRDDERRIHELEVLEEIRENLRRAQYQLSLRDENESLVDAVSALTNLVSSLLIHRHDPINRQVKY